MASQFPPPVDRNDPGQGPTIMAITWTFQILSLGAVTARLAARRHKRLAWSWDDYLMLAAVSLATSSYVHGLGKHDRSLFADELITILRDNFVSVPPGILVGLLSRTSIVILLSRLFAPYKWFRYYLIAYTCLMWVVGVVQMPLTYLQITPVEALWNFMIIPTARWDSRIWLYTAYLSQSLCTFSDLTYALFPVIFIWRLNMPLRERISLILVMGGSLLSMTLSILKTIALAEVAAASPTSPDPQYKASTSLKYGYTEQNIVIIMGCIPALRPFLKLATSKLSSLRKYYSYIRKTTPSEFSSNRYTDLDTDSHQLNYIHTGDGTAKASVGVGNFTRSLHDKRSNDPLPLHDGITRTDGYTITYDTKERIPRETV
ncbi:putative integral membrane [Rosellinia necatrix]|uniref:Putative integral membrane n=1 Tax=Rosellinia necatrix TaxID=77044 RepID=A0A1W2TAJ1_ROSNE|nr:putative integral membrane [Rosellinia necatrix]